MATGSAPGGHARLLGVRRHRRSVLVVGAAAAVTAIGTVVLSRHNTRLARKHLTLRLPAIRAALAAAQPGFVFLAGNSHAECIGIELARLMPLVNGGIGGISARGYAAQLEAMPLSARAGVAVLFLGTNDILRRTDPLSEDTHGEFTAAITHILGWLRRNADVVPVAAVPPLGPEATVLREPAAVAVYTNTLRQLCDRFGCRWLDPFAALRDGGEGVTTQASQPDGVHLRDYATLAAELAPLLRGISEGNVGRRSDGDALPL